MKIALAKKSVHLTTAMMIITVQMKNKERKNSLSNSQSTKLMETLRQSEEAKLGLKDRIFIEGIKEGVRVFGIIGPVMERTK